MQLTPLQLGILTTIANHWQAHGYAPSIRDIQAVNGHSTSVLFYNLNILTGMGLLTRSERIARSIQLTAEGRQYVSDRSEIAVLERLLAERNRVLDLIPVCPIHGPQCMSHAQEWIEESINLREEGLDAQD